MATGIIPPNAQLSEAAKYRDELYKNSYSRLQHLTWRAVNVHGKSNTEIVAVCIQVDSKWRALVDHLMPGQDWQAVRDSGIDPIAHGTAGWDVCTIVAAMCPSIANEATEKPSEGYFKVFVLADGGATIFEIEPKEQVLM